MPKMDGFELTRKIRAMPQYKFVPIVLLTTESTAKRNSKARLPAQPLDRQTFDPDQLLAVVKKVIR